MLAGCAPCQPFSTYSQRYDITGDPRWDLLNSFARHVVEIQPDIVTRENVPSVIQHKVFQDFVDTLEAIGYSVHSQIVNWVDYGVAQTRKRLVLLASRHGTIPLVKGCEGQLSQITRPENRSGSTFCRSCTPNLRKAFCPTQPEWGDSILK